MPQGGDDLIVCSQLYPQGDNQDHQRRQLELSQPGERPCAHAGTGAQPCAQSHCGDVTGQIPKRAKSGVHEITPFSSFFSSSIHGFRCLCKCGIMMISIRKSHDVPDGAAGTVYHMNEF